MFSSFRTGALSASASMLVRSTESAPSMARAVDIKSVSSSMSAIRVSTLSPPTA